MTIKTGVRVLGIRPEMVLGIGVIRDYFREQGYPFVITSVIDGVHKRASIHFGGGASDVRRPDWPSFDRQLEMERAVIELRARLGDDFDVVLEKDHIHVEFQPKASY